MNVEALDNLDHFIGSESFYRYSPLFPMVLTEGAKYLADNADCYWLFDVVGSVLYPRILRGNRFLLARIKKFKTSRGAKFELEDGNGKRLYVQRIDYTDFPLDSYEFYVVGNGTYWTAMLKSEY